jgi:hypothetical protein
MAPKISELLVGDAFWVFPFSKWLLEADAHTQHCPSVTVLKSCFFPEEHWFLSWAHRLTKGRIKGKHPSLYFVFVSFYLGSSLLQSFCSHLGIQKGLKITKPHLTNPVTAACHPGLSEYTCDLGCLILMHTSPVAPSSSSYLNLKQMSVEEDGRLPGF